MTNEQFDTILKNKETKIVIMSALWCPPCKVLSKTVDKIKKENPDFDDKIIKIDVDADPTLSERFNVMSIPTLLFLKNGEIEIKKGNQDEKVLLSWFE
jgi:thioredoxin 1